MKNKVLFLYNTRSGSHNMMEKEVIARVKFNLRPDQKLTVHKIAKKKKGDEGILNHIHSEDWEFVIIGGGDGTIRRLAAVMIEKNFHFPIAILPLGSANGLATCLGVGDFDTALQTMNTSNYISMDIVCINDRISLHLSDFGFNAGLVKKFDESDERGMFAYFKGSFSEMKANEPYKFQIKIDQKEIEVEARMLMVANGNMYGTGAKINPTGKLDDGLFEIIAFNPTGINDLLKFSFNLFKGDLDNDEHVRTWKVDNAIIRNIEKAKFQIDGDMEENADEIRVSIIKNRIKVRVHERSMKNVSAFMGGNI